MGLFDLFSDAKDNMDKKRQAREYLKRAKELVREGEDIYERAYDKVTSYASETEYRLHKHLDYKNKVAKELGSNIRDTLRNFETFNIDAKIVTAPSFQESSTFLSSISSVSSNFESARSNLMQHRQDMPSILDLFISDEDYYEARHQRDEARYFKDRMKMEREKLNNYKNKMGEIRTFIDSEKRELDSLMGKLKKMTSELKSGMKKKSFSSEEAEYLKGIHQISEMIVGLLSTDFLNDGFSINKRYQKAFEGVKSINQDLPYAPSITDVKTLEAIKRMLDRNIAY